MGVEFVVLGIENQQHIHYAMPLRHMIYDAMGYLKDTRNYKRLDVKSSDPDVIFIENAKRRQDAAVFSDYKMNLLEVRDSAGYAFRNEDVQSAFEITREVFAGNFAGIRERYKDKRISSEALSLIGQMAGSTESMEMGKSMEVTNMCTALERLKAEGIEQGMEKGVEKTVISMLKKNYPISEICEITGKTEEEILKIKETM